jgi:integrase
MPRLYRRGEIWWYQFRGGRYSTHCTDKKAAELESREIERRVADPAYRAANQSTLADVYPDFIAQQQQRGRAAGTLKMYETHLAHLGRVLGAAAPLASLNAARLDGYVNTRHREGAQSPTIHKELTTLRGMLKLARRHGKYQFALDEVMPLVQGASKPGKRHLTEAQVPKLLAALAPKRAAFVAFIVATGADLSSAETAETGDIDLQAGTILVRGTKTNHRHREIPILKPFAKYAERAAKGLPFERWGNVRRDLEVACRHAKVPRVTPRDLRRTHGSILRQAGVEPHLIGKMLGHADSRMVEKVYGQLPADALGKLMGARVGATRTPITQSRRKRGKGSA